MSSSSQENSLVDGQVSYYPEESVGFLNSAAVVAVEHSIGPFINRNVTGEKCNAYKHKATMTSFTAIWPDLISLCMHIFVALKNVQ